MDDAVTLARLGLSVVFAVAGVAKLCDLTGTRRALSDFDVPDRLAAPAAGLLPIVELLTAMGLVWTTTARAASAVAVILLGLFVAGLTRALLRGDRPDCHCFGQVHSRPSSWETVARNVALGLPAAYVAVVGPGPSLAAWADGRDAQQLGLVATGSLATVATFTAAVLWRENRRLRTSTPAAQVKEVPIGARAPRFTLPAAAGKSVSLLDLLSAGRPCMLTFVAPGCGPCASLLPEIARWRDVLSERIALPVVVAGEIAEADRLRDEFGLGQVLADPGSAISRSYGVLATPCSLLVAANGTVESAPAFGQVAIEALVRLALRAAPEPSPPLRTTA